MERLWQKAKAEMKPGSTFISNSFPAPATPEQVEESAEERDFKLYTYKI
jgi:hypothetical protein